MEKVPIESFDDQFAELVQRVEQGEAVTITRDGKPVLDLVLREVKAVESAVGEPARKKGLNYEALEAWKRKKGYDKLVTWISPDFDDPLPEDFLLQPLPDPVIRPNDK